jgi:hypothetical protein
MEFTSDSEDGGLKAARSETPSGFCVYVSQGPWSWAKNAPVHRTQSANNTRDLVRNKRQYSNGSAVMEYKPVVTTNTIHIASNIPLVSISVFAFFSIGIKDRRDHCSVATIMIFGIASIVAPLRRILEREMTEANRNGFVVGVLMLSIFITGNETVGEEHV